MQKAVIFDLDGVLVSTDALHFKAWQRIAQDLGITTFTEEDNLRQRGVSREQSLEVVLEKTSMVYTPEQKQELCERKNNYYKEMLAALDETAVLAGAVDTLNYLKGKGVLVAVGSVSKNTPEILKRTRLEGYIDKVSCGLDITRSKPDPEVFLVAAKKLGVLPEHCLVVEDSEAGLVAAKAGNMATVGVGTAQGSLHADFSSPSLAENIPWEELLRV